MSTITRELAKLFRKITNSEIDAEGNAHVVLSPADSLLINNARIALASLEAEAVAYIIQDAQARGLGRPGFLSFDASISDEDINEYEISVTPLYTAPQLPQPAVAVPLAIHDEDFEKALSVLNDTLDDCGDSERGLLLALDKAGIEVRSDACRAAMLQGKSEQPQNAQQNIPENIPGGNSPGTPDSWISCSDRMPEKGQNVLISVNFDSSLVEPLICSARYTGSTFRRGDATIKPGNGIEQATHWMPLPEPPQEVK
ncbi:DUF551 domain-containing protein [Escherichia coli]|uniref:DUF551 domain-containing protein n=1 Tax=Escherichia coli TaxID=562 RepID=UPI0027960497|nr:DUF551 domain-containing protein [Escherichia coli]